MKKLILLSFLAAMALQLDAQKLDFWLDAGIKIQSGFTGLYNSEATTSGNSDYDFAVAKGTKYGGKFGFNFNYTGISFDLLTGKSRGEFNGLGGRAENREITITSTDLYVLLRNARNKGYIEIGPKMSFINKVEYQDGAETVSATDLYEDKNLAAVLGFGTYILGPEDGRFSGVFGLRFEYGFQDIVNEAGRIEGENRQPVNYTGAFGATNNIFAGIVFELNWGIGGVGQARCGERSKFMWF